MKKIILTLTLLTLFMPFTATISNASMVSNRKYRVEQRREEKQNLRQIKDLFKLHNKLANEHNLEELAKIYSDKYINNDGFNKEAYFKSIESTWESCKDIVYSVKVTNIEIEGGYANVYTEENASGTITEKAEAYNITGEIHSISKGIYHLENVNGNWYISGETALSDESSLLYGDARFMNIEIQTPSQVSAGESYTASLKVDVDDKTFVMASINSDPVVYPVNPPETNLRILPQSKVLERVIKANTDNINEYVVASMAISKVKPLGVEDYSIYMAGLACLMKRINVVPKNNYVKIEE